jgi:hypothetical protein
VAGDYRFAQLAAITLGAALIAYSRPGLMSFASAAILLLQPRGMYIVERGWSDPFVLLPLSGVVFCAARLPRAAPWIMGLFFASKQYVLLSGCAALLVVGRPALLARAVLAACAVTFPLVLWNVEAFWQSAVVLQFRQPFRWDSLSFVAAWMQGNRQLPGMALAVPFIAVGAASALVLWRCGKTPAGFAAGTALILFAFFAFNKQAFGNYYYVVIGAMCCAIAAGAAEGGT